ncbi:dynein heavy chain 5, axonemal-like [Trachemys scripta elegans]|uniref:dynein heavy chain 5, axonemal-like n=1 Tax=Trachemys scripta elegans TaxID=31138 RepID=UPI00155785FC|nr:dynein heavy chain 5, axonemal-like [Trachemys scripta elegans]
MEKKLEGIVNVHLSFNVTRTVCELHYPAVSHLLSHCLRLLCVLLQMEAAGGCVTESGGGGELSPATPEPAQQETDQEPREALAVSKPDTELSPPLITINKDGEGKGHRRRGAFKKNTEPRSAITVSSSTAAVSPNGKKNVVLSSEAKKELAKQAKVTKEERRAQLDDRHKYLILRLADGIGLNEQEVEDFVISDEKFQLVGEFFAENRLKKLLFFYQDAWQQKSNVPLRTDGSSPSSLLQKKLFITMGSTEGLTGTCAFFLRTTDKAITTANISQEVNFGMFDCTNGNILQGLEIFLAQVMVPALKSQQHWGAVKEGLKNSQIQDFLYSVDKFVGTLSSARQNLEDKIQLQKVDIESYLNNLHNPSDYITAGSNIEVIEKLEGVLIIWIKQIGQILVESEQMRKEADDIGPAAELEHWKSRMASFNSLLDEIKSPRVNKVLSILQAAKSRLLKQWKELDGNVTNAANEAKDNVKYLYTLDKFFGPLGKASPAAIVEHIPSLMNSIRMIYSTSPYYNTSEQMTSLLLKITNQMINTCKIYLSEGVLKIWDLDRQELLKRVQECIYLNEQYQTYFQRVREKLKENPSDRQFDFSENYIFGKFDAFCKRLEKISDISNIMEGLLELQNIKIEGIEKINARYQMIATNTKSKTYDVLDHRKQEFEEDYLEFKNQIEGLHQSMQELVDSWFEKSLTTEQMLGLLMKFEHIGKDHIDLTEKYIIVLQRYSRELDLVRKLYQKQKENPPMPRNVPPVTGKIMWARQLFRKIDHPMKFFKKKTALLKTPEMKKVIWSYNKMAAVLLEFELLYHRAWCRFAEQAKNGLRASLLVRHPETKELFVNLDPMVLEVLCETKYLKKMNFEVPDVALGMCAEEEQIKEQQMKLQDLLTDYKKFVNRIPAILEPLMKPFMEQIEESLTPGLTQLSWTSPNIDTFLKKVYNSLEEVGYIVKEASDTLECRIERILQDMSDTPLVTLPEDDPIEVLAFLERTEKLTATAAETLSQQSQQVERSMYELIDILKHRLKPEDKTNLQDSFACGHLDMKQKTRCQECLSCSYYNLMGQLCQKNTDSLVKCTRISLDALRRRLHVLNSKYQMTKFIKDQRVPLFKAEIQLAIPNVVLRPSLDDIQNAVNKAVNIILSMARDIPLWKFAHLHHRQQQMEQTAAIELGDESKLTKMAALRPLDKQISEHKDVNKAMIQLTTIILSLKTEALDILKSFAKFSSIWNQDPEEKVKEFLETNPVMSEFRTQINYFSLLEIQIRELPSHCILESVDFATESLKMALIQECHLRQRSFGLALNKKAAMDMDAIYTFIDNLSKRLNRPINDLDDVRGAMEALKEIREAEIKIDMTIGPIEESYALLHKYDLLFKDGNAERVDGLAYAWKNLNTQVLKIQDLLLEVQPSMKTDLLNGVKKFQIDAVEFYTDYNEKGPGAEDIPPWEASDRLQIFQAKFDELWRKYITFSGGEELFGLSVTEYPELQKIKRELTLLQKLYGLYNSVNANISGYYEIFWSDLDIEKINSELLDFQNRIRKLPKALKEWQAFHDLKKKIDDFAESCPLLEMMANKAMMPRHWERIAQVTGHKFDVVSESFSLKNIMDASLLKYKEDIEDICISAVKEKDIEAKLKHVINEWSTHVFTFGQFKTRGELLLKGSDTSEKIALMEDSLMILGSLMSNRYNAPFKPTIQQWVQKLANTTEIIENWITVQNLWIYLEAVFVGGDIAKQLPQEAKRFQNIDKSWQKIMQRAHETSNIVQCCVGDETLAQLLPHLLEQLEICQKSLTGYLEKKRLVFPRFFFVSDPALLEILGQASDSHTIQAHLLSLFDNVNRVGFHEKNYDQILLFESQEGEQVNIIEPVLAQGNVEFWLGQLLNGIKKTIHSIIRQASIAISDSGFKLYDFQTMFPAQIGLLGIQMIWTRDAEDALNNAKTDKKVMHTTNLKFLDLLNDLIDMTTRNLTRMERTKYETLITIHVHQKDIFDDLVRMNIKSPSDFEWQKQSRFYFIEDVDKCIIQITDVEFNYCNEYLGCTDRLVITPLTDRCYITLAQALGMSMGGAPAGPAGTGKTETTKDMGKCLGKYVVVFNCSDQMDYRGLGRIYKGLAQSGAWGCFDEFNRIELPVLSVAAQQIYIVLQCKKSKKLQFIFTDGDVVDMDREFGIFLTMNPGYAGRQELPENLKIQFRTVAMMVPDRGIIMRVKLASAGFRDNQILSRKFYTLYKLCEEQLSKQVHYDFGLRNILSVLRTLGAVKRSNPNEPEKTVVMRVLRDMNLSKLVDEDEPLFMSLINDLFPGITLDKVGYPELESAIRKETEKAGLIHHPPWILKLIQLYETQRVRHGMMTLGPTGAGKTKCINILMKAMTDCGTPHKEMRMNPKAITASQMFGTLDVATNDWTDGIFSTLWRKTLKAKKGEHIWIVLDGPVDAIWIENLNSVLDDNKTLTLANGDRIPMSPNCKIVFEPHNIDNASPATVSRNGMVFMSSSVLDWRPILKAWLQTLPATHSDVLWNSFNSVFQMLPTPAKFHYIFNLRDLSRIWQGILTVSAEVCQNTSVLAALFQHECSRVIADRFINQNDKGWFEDMMRKIASEDHCQDLLGNDHKELYFVDFLRDAPEATGDEPDEVELEAPKIYESIPSFDNLAERLQMFMQQYNETIRGTHMDLVFFKDAMIHLVKISRIIRTPQGNALLVGVGGSGKQSLTRLASYIAGYQSFQITLTRTYGINNLMDDLKTLYRTAGQKGQGITFIFTDNEIRDESFLEYMNNVLASGEVSNLFARDEIDEITQDLISVMKKEYPRRSPSSENLYDYFLTRVRNNLHVVLCFSPVGEKFRTRALKFPGLISGCTMDWFQRWPKDALVAVAQHFLASYKIECTDEVKQSVVNTMGTFQDLVAEKCVEYFERYRRQTFVTPKSYLSFISGYKTIYREKFAGVGNLSDRMKTGLAKLMEAEISVNQLSKELAVKERDLAVASKRADGVLLDVTMKAQAAEKVKMQVQKVKDKAHAIVDEIAIDKAAAEEKLEAARPALEEAEAALQTIKPVDIATVRKLGKPPHLIMRIMDCVLLLFQRKIDSVTADPERTCVKPSWTEALKLMNNSGFLSMLLTFQKDSITGEIAELLQPYLDMEDYNLETAKKVCGNVAGLCSWTQAMAYFYSINKEVLPLKANLALQEARLAVAQTELNNAQNQLDEKQRELDQVQAMYNAAMQEKQTLLDDAEACRRKMNNATDLIEGLGGEKIRWTESSKNFQNQIIRLVGNVLLATGFLSYSGPFNQEYRNLLLRLWKTEMDRNRIPYSDDLNLISMLVDNATIGEWSLQGLPNDDLSIQNGIIVTKASRYPLLIDPQGQGKSWIKNKEKNNELQVHSLFKAFFIFVSCVKAGLKRTYSAITQEQLEVSNMPQWKPLLYAVAFLHTTVQERRKFGPLGWNIPYEFNQADFAASVQFIQNHLDDVDIKRGVNWSCVRYMLGEVQYGGRVTDDLDKMLLNTFARVWFGESMFTDKFCFYKGYIIPKGKTVEDYLQHIEQLPIVDTPEVFGLHPNADITYQTNMANETLSTIVSIQPKDSGSGGGETREAMVQRLADEMLEKLPPDYIPHEVKAQLQKMGAIQPLNIFLRQEIDRMQRVISRVRTTLTDLKLAIDGTIIMSEDLRDALDNMYDARIPKLWFKISWESATLGFWFTELLERNQQFSSWLLDGRPNQFWMTGFFNPQGFLTAMRQETTRMNLAKGWALDSVILHNDVTRMMKEDISSPPPADIGGVYIYGLFLDGAGWDRRNTKLTESAPKVLFTSLPVVHVYAISTTAPPDPKKQPGSLYSCPVYKKPRRTDLTYIFSLYLKTVQNPDHWTLRGVALLCDSK